MLILRPADVVHEAVKTGDGGGLVPAQLRCCLGQAASAAFLEGPHPHTGGIEDRLILGFTGHHYRQATSISRLLREVVLVFVITDRTGGLTKKPGDSPRACWGPGSLLKWQCRRACPENSAMPAKCA